MLKRFITNTGQTSLILDLLIIDLRDLATSLSHWGLGSREVAQAAND